MNKMREEATKDTSNDEDRGIVAENGIWTDLVPPTAVDHEDEYVDEERFTTVTVEAVDISKDGLRAVAEDEEDGTEKQDGGTSELKEKERNKIARASSGKLRSKEKGAKGLGTTKKKKKFRYESKGERKIERVKQRLAKNKKRKKSE